MAFDELIMGADVSPLWDVVRGGGAVEVAPFPNAVDRSLRLTSSPSGDPKTLCELTSALGQSPVRVSADFLTFGDAVGTALRLELDGEAIGLVIREHGEVGMEPVGRFPVGAIGAAQWYRAMLTIDPARGTYRVAAIPRTGTPIAAREASLPATWRSALSDLRVCISGPAVAGAELFVDNVTIE